MKSPDSGKFDLVMRDADFVIYYDHNPLATAGGSEVAHQDSRLLKHILIEFSLSGQIDSQTINSFTVFSFCKDFIERGKDPVSENMEQLLSLDPLLNAKFNPGKSNRLIGLRQVLDDLEGNNQIMNLIFLGASVITKSLKDLFAAMENFNEIEKDFPGHRAEIMQYFSELYHSLSSEKKSAINMLSAGHNSGILLPLLLILSKISCSEYSLATLSVQNDNLDRETSKLTGYSLKGSDLKPIIAGWDNPEESFHVLHGQALKTMEFLSFYENPGKKMSVISELISQGENDKVEFKSTFRWDIRQDKKNPAIEHAALKSIAAFLNSDGGDLLIGVADDGSIIGLEKDNFSNDDKFLLHVWTLIKTSIGKDISPFITTSLEKFDDKTVCRIHCKRSPKPVFLRQSGYDVMFYIRIGPSSGNLDISEALKYIGDHF